MPLEIPSHQWDGLTGYSRNTSGSLICAQSGRRLKSTGCLVLLERFVLLAMSKAPLGLLWMMARLWGPQEALIETFRIK